MFDIVAKNDKGATSDTQLMFGKGGCQGARGSYGYALGEAGAGLAELVREMDSRTTLLVLADHGSVDRGGSGGAEAHATHVPLLAYRPGSNLGGAQRFSSAPHEAHAPYSKGVIVYTYGAAAGSLTSPSPIGLYGS